jgi:hypothetical protein
MDDMATIATKVKMKMRTIEREVTIAKLRMLFQISPFSDFTNAFFIQCFFHFGLDKNNKILPKMTLNFEALKCEVIRGYHFAAAGARNQNAKRIYIPRNSYGQ